MKVMHKNIIGIPWLIAFRRHGEVMGNWMDGLDHIIYDNISNPTKDRDGWFIFSLNRGDQAVAMVRCLGKSTKDFIIRYAEERIEKPEGGAPVSMVLDAASGSCQEMLDSWDEAKAEIDADLSDVECIGGTQHDVECIIRDLCRARMGENDIPYIDNIGQAAQAVISYMNQLFKHDEETISKLREENTRLKGHVIDANKGAARNAEAVKVLLARHGKDL